MTRFDSDAMMIDMSKTRRRSLMRALFGEARALPSQVALEKWAHEHAKKPEFRLKKIDIPRRGDPDYVENGPRAGDVDEDKLYVVMARAFGLDPDDENVSNWLIDAVDSTARRVRGESVGLRESAASGGFKVILTPSWSKTSAVAWLANWALSEMSFDDHGLRGRPGGAQRWATARIDELLSSASRAGVGDASRWLFGLVKDLHGPSGKNVYLSAGRASDYRLVDGRIETTHVFEPYQFGEWFQIDDLQRALLAL